MNLLALYLKGWRPSLCTRKYEEMATTIFSKGLLQVIPGLSSMLALWNTARYSSDALEKVVEDQYGEKRGMLDPSYASSVGARVILPAARVPDPSIVLFTNYNGNADTTRGGAGASMNRLRMRAGPWLTKQVTTSTTIAARLRFQPCKYCCK